MPYLIDGHNLIAHLPDIDLDDPDDEAKLVLKLRGYTARTGKHCTVVFDRGLPGGESRLSTRSVKVIFASSSYSTADKIIMERVRDIRDTNGWIIVTSDNEIIAAARERGMQALRCKNFAQILRRPSRPTSHPGLEENVRVSPNEVNAWLEVFGTEEDIEPLSVEQPRIRPATEDTSSADEAQKPARPATNAAAHKPQLRADARNKHTPHLSEDEITAWLDAFGEYEPGVDLKEQLKRDRYVARRRNRPASEQGKSSLKRHTRQNRSAARYQPPAEDRKGTEEDPYISQEEADLFLDLFDDEDET